MKEASIEASFLLYNVRMAKNKKNKKETIIQVVGLVFTVCAFVAAVFAVTTMINKPKTSESDVTTYSGSVRQKPVLLFDGKEYQMKDDLEVILIMGIDDREDIGDANTYYNNSQADVLYVYAIDHKNKQYQAIQINRDTMTGVQTYTADGYKDSLIPMQICLAHGYGKTEQGRCVNTVEAVSGLLFDIPIDHYISLNMSAIPVLNEQVGGVTVTVPEGLESADPAFKEGATVTLQGKQAETFVRARMGLDNDTNEFRMQRQQIFLTAWKEQANAKMNNDSGFAMNLVFALSDYMVSDMTANRLSDFASQLSDYEDLGTIKTEGETLEEGEGRSFREYHVDMDDLQRKVIAIFYEEVKEET